MEAMNLKIGKKLKSLHNTRTMSLDDVSALTGVSKPMLGQIERSQSIPTVTILWKIATGLKTPLSYFLEGPQAKYTIVSPDQADVICGPNRDKQVFASMADETKTNATPEAPGGPSAPEQTEQAVIPGMDGGPAA